MKHEVSPTLPEKPIILDASAEPEIIEQLYRRKVILVAPEIQRVGKLFQVTKRTNGISSMVGLGDTPSKYSVELIRQTQELIKVRGYKSPAVISHKGSEKFWVDVVGSKHTLHFGAIRGSTNKLETCDRLVITGVPGIPPAEIERFALVIWHDRMERFVPRILGTNAKRKQIILRWFSPTKNGLHLRCDRGIQTTGRLSG